MRTDRAAAGPPPVNEPAWHALPAAEVLDRLGSGELGLEDAEAQARLDRDGPNALPERRRRSGWLVFLAQFKSPLIYLLFAAAAIAAAIGEVSDAIVILSVVVLNSIIGTFQEGRAERSMDALRRLAALEARVLRGGVERRVTAAAVVRGDVLVLTAGDAVAADSRLLAATDLATAEAALTGESLPIAKSPEPVEPDAVTGDHRDMVYAGTHVVAGRGRAVVVATGTGTEVGRIAILAEATVEPRTPLALRLERFSQALLVGAVALFLVVLVAGLLRGMPFAAMLMVATSQLVSVVPEGLPVATTIALAVGMQRMARRRAIVRKLAAVESLGATTVICSDKTGTLTRNEMTVTAIAMPGGRAIEVSGVGYEPEGRLVERGEEVAAGSDPALKELLEALVLCNDAELVSPRPDGSRPPPLGDPTEAALLTVALKGGIDPTRMRQADPRRAEIPFTAEAKMMATAHESGRVVLKGAPEGVLELCSHARVGAATVPLDPGLRRELAGAGQALAEQALRLLAVAVVGPVAAADPRASALAGGFAGLAGRGVFLGLVGQLDPPRDGVAAAVAACRTAGIRTIMITGDHPLTALAVARAIGIAGEADRPVEGRSLANTPDADLVALVSRTPVFARIHPAQKLRIVGALQGQGEVVAMTGDGVNDAPALARADVGVAMGITGTEVAKQAAAVVLTDDDFSTLVRAVEEGRLAYRNLKKVILLLLSTGLAEVAVLLLALATGLPLPFAAVQILWNNIVTEGTIALNLIFDPKDGDEMRRPPVPRSEPILTRAMVGRLLAMSAAITVSTLGYFAWSLSRGVPEAEARTATFTLLAVCEWFNVINCRSETKSALSLDLLRNRWLLGGIVLSNFLQVAVVFLPPLNRVFHTVALPWSQVFAIGAVASLVLWIEEARKWWVRRRLAPAAG